MTNYTRLASIRPIVLSSSAYRHASGTVFTEGRRTSVTLVNSPDHPRYLFKLGNKVPLFTASNNPDGTVKLTSTHTNFPCWLTIDGSEIIRLAKKAKLDIALITSEELPPDNNADLLDLAHAHFDSSNRPTHHQVPALKPRQNHGQRAPRHKEPQRGTRLETPATPGYTAKQFSQDVALLWG